MRYFLRNCRMNEKIHHFFIKLCVLGWTTPEVLPSFTFMAFYSRRLRTGSCQIVPTLNDNHFWCTTSSKKLKKFMTKIPKS